MAKRPTSARRTMNPVFPVLIVLALVGGFVLLIASRDTGSGPDSNNATSTSTSTTSTSTTAPPDPVPVSALELPPLPEDTPRSYRIEYDVNEVDVARTETITVNRPYESLITSERNGEITSGTATSTTLLYTYLADRAGWLGTQAELHRAASDHRPLAAMATMIELGLADETGTGEYVGRTCRRFVTGQSLSASVVSAPAEDETTELCVDDTGLVLYERWQNSGDVLLERTAVDVEVGVDTSDVAFDPKPLIEDAESFQEALGHPAVPATDDVLAALRTEIRLPDGYSDDGAAVRTGSGAEEVVRFYSSGAELIELAEVVVSGPANIADGGAVPVDIEGFEDVWFVPSFRASALRMQLSETTYVELRGTTPAQLVELLRTMTVESS